MKVSVLCMETCDVGRAVDLAVRGEAAGLYGFWVGTALGFDPFVVLAAAATATSSIRLGTAIVPTWPRHPIATAQQAASLDALSGGRFRLGVGPSHEPAVTGIYGLAYEDPVGHTREYVEVVRALLREGRVRHTGRHYQVRASLSVAGAGHSPVMVSALHERMCRMTGAVADGVLPWLAPPTHVAGTVVPNVADGAAGRDRPAPPVIAGFPCLLTDDPSDEGRAIVQHAFGLSARMPSYQRLMGATDEDAWIDAALATVIACGDEHVLEGRIREYVDVGVDEVMVAPLTADPAIFDVLGRISKEHTRWQPS